MLQRTVYKCDGSVPLALRPRLTRLPAPAHPDLAALQVWALDTAGGDDLAARLARLLPPGERPASAARTPRAATRRTAAVLARVALRALAERADEPLRRGEHGRPSWPSGPAFSLSYAGPLAVIALAGAAGDVGVDVEVALDADADPLELAEAAGFAASERAAIAADRAPADCFVRLWTLKEAAAKAAGTGIGSVAWHAPVRCCDDAQTVRCATGSGIVAGVDGPAGHRIAVARWWPQTAAGQAASLCATAGGGSPTNSGGQMSR